MFIFVLILAILLIILWSKVHQNSLHSRLLEHSIDLLERKVEDLAHTVQELRSRPKPTAEPALAEPSPPLKPQAVEQRIATPLRTEAAALKTPIVTAPVIQPPIEAPSPVVPRVEPEPVLPPPPLQPTFQRQGSPCRRFHLSTVVFRPAPA